MASQQLTLQIELSQQIDKTIALVTDHGRWEGKLVRLAGGMVNVMTDTALVWIAIEKIVAIEVMVEE